MLLEMVPFLHRDVYQLPSYILKKEVTITDQLIINKLVTRIFEHTKCPVLQGRGDYLSNILI